ncbi:MAG: hypothetical protein QNJ81_13420 [Acidimicrobiia bacterium]|nr:hypothetical protein [Acidimicrobiia bacterium]
MLWLIVAVAILIALGLALQAATKPDHFRVAGASLGLDHSRTVPELLPRLSGTINGLAVRVDVPEPNSPAVRYRIFYPALGMSLRLEKETTIGRTMGTLGGGDQQVGDKAFDDSLRVNTSRPDALEKMLTRDLRRRLVALVEHYPEVVVADGEIELISTAEPTAENLITTVNDLVLVAGLLTANRPPPLTRPQPRPVVRTQRPAPASPETGAAEESPAPAPRPAAAEVPAPAEPQAAAAPEPAPPPPPPAPVETTGLPDGFFDEVFGESRLSFEADDRFERELEGADVRLSGTVKQSSHYDDRRDFSPTSGTKAVVTVAQIDNDLYGKTDIDAVVYLQGKRNLERGEMVRFAGKLTGVDAFMRNLFVSDADLTGG